MLFLLNKRLYRILKYRWSIINSSTITALLVISLQYRHRWTPKGTLRYIHKGIDTIKYQFPTFLYPFYSEFYADSESDCLQYFNKKKFSITFF